MKTSDFGYNLPESSIAQTPLEPRDSSRLLVLHRDTGEVEHRVFREIGDYLRAGDLLVLNQTRVDAHESSGFGYGYGYGYGYGREKTQA